MLLKFLFVDAFFSYSDTHIVFSGASSFTSR